MSLDHPHSSYFIFDSLSKQNMPAWSARFSPLYQLPHPSSSISLPTTEPARAFLSPSLPTCLSLSLAVSPRSLYYPSLSHLAPLPTAGSLLVSPPQRTVIGAPPSLSSPPLLPPPSESSCARSGSAASSPTTRHTLPQCCRKQSCMPFTRRLNVTQRSTVLLV
jgi:hypothetical protein